METEISIYERAKQIIQKCWKAETLDKAENVLEADTAEGPVATEEADTAERTV